MFRKAPYLGANDYVNMSEGLDSSMLAQLGSRRRRRVLIVLSLVIVLFIGCAWTASNPAAFGWLSRVAPPVARLLRPSAGSQAENGIRMDVVESIREGDSLTVHLTMEDLEGNRLNGSLTPEWWEFRQDRQSVSGWCSREFDPETGSLHLYLTCDMPELDWERWLTVTVYNLEYTSGQSLTELPVPLTLSDSVRVCDGLSAQMTVSGSKLRVELRTDPAYTLPSFRPILSGPNGEQVQLLRQSQEGAVQSWVFDLGSRDIADCSLSVWMAPGSFHIGTWSIQIDPDAQK